MPVLSLQINEPGQAGVRPAIVRIQTNDTLAEVMTTGYLDHMVAENIPLQNGMMALVETKPSPNSSVTQSSWLDIVFASGRWSLTATAVSPSSITLPTIANHMAVFTDVAGSLGEDVSTAVNGGNIQAGLSGTAGYLASFPSAALKGSFRVVAVANTGDTLVTLSNVAHGQATVYSIPDAGNALGRVLVGASATPFVTGRLLVSSGTGGLVADSGASVKAQTTATYAGGGTSNAFTATGLTATSIVTANILTSTNSVSITKVVPGTNLLTITFSADPGAGTTVNYIAFSAAI